MVRSLISIGLLLVIFEALFLDRYSYFAKEGLKSLDGFISFYAVLGFLGWFLLIYLCKVLAVMLKIGETYYNDDF